MNDSIKQEAGQFFTPVPLTQFIIKSLPIEEMIKTKIANGEQEVLPYVIDYACGTGHFLTEIMDTMNDIIRNNIDISSISKPSVQREFKNWQDSDFEWAEKYIYGIDLDYRLIKASKISCFLNGDGKANLLHANGLAPFNSEDYVGKLHNPSAKQDNQKFDILIANPPYSVKTFKPTIKDGDKSFELFDGFTENSSEIECLFVERAKQLLKEGGYAGIVLPVSLLTNDKIYIRTREILLKYFDIKGILSLQDKAFMATGTKTIILLMQRRNNTYWEQINLAVKTFFDNYKNVTVAGIEKAFSKFVEINYENLSFEDYISILKNNPTESTKKSEYYEEHKNLSIDDLRELEADKMLYFFLSYNSKLVLANSGEYNAEKEFLGYEFSNRRGFEGINIYKDEENHIISCLFSDIDIYDEEKLNSYILQNFCNKNIEPIISHINMQEEHSLKGYMTYCRLSDLINFSLNSFNKKINLNFKKKVVFESKYPLKPIENFINIQSGLWTGEKGKLVSAKVLRNTNFKLNNGLLSYDDIAEIKVEEEQLKDRTLKYGDIILEKSGGSNTQAIGRVALFDKKDSEQYSYSNFCSRLRVKDTNEINPVYLWAILNDFYNKGGTLSLQNGLRLLNIDLNGYLKTKIPLPDINIQNEIINNIETEKIKEESNLKRIYALNKEILNLIESVKGEVNSLVSIVTKITDGSHNPPPKVYTKDFYMLSAINITNYGLDLSAGCRYISESDYIRENKRTQIQENDILLSIVGTIGKSILVDKNIANITIQRSVAVIRPNIEIIEPKFLLFYIRSALFQNKLEELAHGSQQQGVYLDQLKDIKIPVPDIEEQRRIVAEILPLEAEIEKLQREIDEIPAKKQAILDKYLK